ncbi:guanylate kinase [Elizabethkingia argentiflava]|uniref:Guanylate kinase n=1 Tax=Elizabethkingia argenteiflava TaxID=2681556 RepID=A0A845PXN3_9FLAO|nr:guanylate kinase [Elizabethkingia argenteiflava]NAW50840.1 guanylate kinase [Elizabethkingia argenteiflava]
MNKVIIFSAPSGSGKTTLVKHCLKKFSTLQFSISATTRLPRGEEKHGEDYFFHTPEDFRKKIEENAFVEFEEVYADRYYGTLKTEVEKIWKAGNVVIFDVDVKGGVSLKKIFGEQALSIFIAPPSVESLKERLIHRATDDAKAIEVRIAKAEEEMKYANDFDKVIVNDDLEQAKAQIEQLIEAFINA